MPDLDEYRQSPNERLRSADLMRMTPPRGGVALDVGARDGHFSRLLAERFDRVVALDLTRPSIDHPKIDCVQGDITSLDLDDDSVDFVLCAEVLEHIPSGLLAKACAELQRVCRGRLLIGVPNRQDLRLHRTTCAACGRTNPPWGHVNRFEESTLEALFPGCGVEEVSFVGTTRDATNAVASALMAWAGNPYGTYEQDEACVHCGGAIGRPASRSVAQKVLTKLGFWAQATSASREPERGNWLHMRLNKRAA